VGRKRNADRIFVMKLLDCICSEYQEGGAVRLSTWIMEDEIDGTGQTSVKSGLYCY
jgi:hypothetical protein